MSAQKHRTKLSVTTNEDEVLLAIVEQREKEKGKFVSHEHALGYQYDRG